MANTKIKKELPSKEAALFKQILVFQYYYLKRQYEHKQYKKGLKCTDQILKKVPDHGGIIQHSLILETLAMKGLFMSHLNNKEEAYNLVKKGLRNDLFSPICWHVYGLLYRSDKNYEEASKCYKNALKYDKENVQVLRDFSFLQIQMRDFEGFNDSQHQLLKLRPGQRAYWIGLAISYHLLGQFDTSLKVLDKYLETATKAGDDYEHSELLMYRNSIMEESGQYENCLKDLNQIEKDVLDHQAWLEKKATISLKLEKYEEASILYEKLIESNCERFEYLTGLLEAKRINLEDEKQVVSLFENLSEKYPRSNAIKRLMLNYCSGSLFQTKMDQYLQKMIRKGVPSLFVNLKSLFKSKEKSQIAFQLVSDYVKSLKEHQKFSNSPDAQTEPPSAWLWSIIFLAQHYDFMGQSLEALDCIHQALNHTPTLLEAHMFKARIYKHGGHSALAAKAMEEARQLDLQDRFINTKCTKYLIRNDDIQKAEQTISLFTKQGTFQEQMDDLVEMQCMWFSLETAQSYKRQNRPEEALKKYTQILKHFSDFTDDQFDFHTYCIRKMTLRSYLSLLKFEDEIKGNHFYYKSALEASHLLCAKYDESKNEEHLKEALGYLEPLQSLKPNDIPLQAALFELYLRKGKLLLSLKSVLKCQKLNSQDSKSVEIYFKFWHHYQQSAGEQIDPLTKQIVEEHLPKESLVDYLQNIRTIENQLTVCQLSKQYFPNTKLMLDDLIKEVPASQETCRNILQFLGESKERETFRLKCRTVFPIAECFMTQSEKDAFMEQEKKSFMEHETEKIEQLNDSLMEAMKIS